MQFYFDKRHLNRKYVSYIAHVYETVLTLKKIL